jgi:methyl-accepting chemotaxis protein
MVFLVNRSHHLTENITTMETQLQTPEANLKTRSDRAHDTTLVETLKSRLKEQEQFAQRNIKALEEAVDAVVQIDSSKIITFFNGAAERMFGFNRDEVVGQNVKMIVPLEHREAHDQYVDRNISTGVNKVIGKGRDLEATRKDGSKFWINLSLNKIQIGDEFLFTAFIRDISDQKSAITEMESLQVELKTRMDQINVACVVSEADLKGDITYVNDLLCEVSGYKREECIGQPHSMFRHPDMPKSVFKEMWATIGKGKIFRGVIKNRCKDGSAYWVDALIAPVLGANGKPVKYIGVRYVITEQVMKQQELEGQMNAIDAATAYIEFNPDGTILKANDLFLRTMKYRHDEVESKHHRIFCDPSYTRSNEYEQFWSNLRNGESRVGEFRRVAKDRTDVWFQANYTPVKDDKGDVIKVIKLANDITETKLRNADYEGQLEAIGKSNAVIEFNMDGTVITANSN